MRRVLRTAAVALLTGGLVAIFLRNADFGAVWRGIRTSRSDLLIIGVVMMVATYVLRAWRWQYLLAPIGPTRLSNALRTTVIGFAASFLLPARPGEVLRPYLLARREGLSATATFATVIVERALDLLTVALLLALALSRWAAADGETPLVRAIRAGGIAAGTASIAGLVILLVLAGHPERFERLLLRIERVLPARVARAVARFGRLFAEGLGIMRDPRRLAVALLLSLPLWMAIGAQTWLVTRAFGIEIPPTATFVLLAVLVVGVSVPTPGAVGGYHEAYRLTTTGLFGAPSDAAVGAAIVLHAISFVPVTVLGIVFMAQDGVSVGRMRRLAGEAGQEGGLG